MFSKNLLQEIKDYCAVWGFNIFKTISTDLYDGHVHSAKKIKQRYPSARSIILIGFAGNEYWDVLKNYMHENPEFAEDDPDPIDNYTRVVLTGISNLLLSSEHTHDVVFPFGEDSRALDFIALGELCGVGVRSMLGILLHPEYGTWISLRAAIMLEDELSIYDEPLYKFNPCVPCEKPCVVSCPASVISAEQGWDWEACMDYRLETDTCSTHCASRRACPYGSEHQYSEAEQLYHHRRVIENVLKGKL